jgi:hypothetical protein
VPVEEFSKHRNIQRKAPLDSQLAMVLTALVCYNLQRNQLFNSPYESSSFPEFYLEQRGKKNRLEAA